MPLIFLTQSSLCLSLPLYRRGLGERGGGTEDGNEAAEQAEGERDINNSHDTICHTINFQTIFAWFISDSLNSLPPVKKRAMILCLTHEYLPILRWINSDLIIIWWEAIKILEYCMKLCCQERKQFGYLIIIFKLFDKIKIIFIMMAIQNKIILIQAEWTLEHENLVLNALLTLTTN